MRIRTATRYDIDTLVKLLREYSGASPVLALRTQQNEQYVRTLLTQLIMGVGAIWIAEDGERAAGMLIAGRIPNVWNPDVITVNELAFWVEPWARGSSAALRLLRAYQTWAEEQSDAVGSTVSRLHTSEFDPAHHGYTMIEQTYIKQG